MAISSSAPEHTELGSPQEKQQLARTIVPTDPIFVVA